MIFKEILSNLLTTSKFSNIIGAELINIIGVQSYDNVVADSFEISLFQEVYCKYLRTKSLLIAFILQIQGLKK